MSNHVGRIDRLQELVELAQHQYDEAKRLVDVYTRQMVSARAILQNREEELQQALADEDQEREP